MFFSDVKRCTPFSENSHTKYCIVCYLFLFLFISTAYSSLPQDTIPPTYTWLFPTNYSILTTNTIRLSVDAIDNMNGSGINKVLFYASYTNNNGLYKEKQLIGEIPSAPYEFLWDCSHIPDQDIEKLFFYCDVIDNSGNVKSISQNADNENGPLIVLDRNPIEKDIHLSSHQIRNDIVIDGKLNEWAKKDSIVISNNDNKIIAFSSWNKKNLFLGIRVEDKSIISHSYSDIKRFQRENTVKIFHEDIIEIYLDTNHDHYEILSIPDRHFLITPSDVSYEVKCYSEEYYFREYHYPNINYEITVNGTLNEEKDIDTSYTIECAISWKELGVNPEDNNSMGMEIWNNDRDYVDGNYFFSGWTTTAPYLQNPSEWGNIVFVKSKSYFCTIALIIIVLTSVGGAFLLILKKRVYRLEDVKANTNDEGSLNIERDKIQKAKIYIEENYQKDTLTRDMVAKHVGFAPSYFGNLFKDETGYNFTNYIINLRLEKAKELLVNSDKNISEIAFEVGFNSQSYFGSMFKKKAKKSPKEFRADQKKN